MAASEGDTMIEDEKRDLAPEELEHEGGRAMPDREEMSLIPGLGTMPALPTLPVGGAPTVPTDPPPGAALPDTALPAPGPGTSDPVATAHAPATE
jgi:hypothetical protein